MAEVFPLPLHFDNAGMINGKRWIILTAKFQAITSLGVIEAPVGVRSDGGSIPRVAWSIIGCPFDECLEECVIHDFLYSDLNSEYTRAEADLVLCELMWNRGHSKIKIAAFNLAVRLFGGQHFRGQLR